MPGPRISVVTAAYNVGPPLLRSLESVLAQEGVDFEVVVIDDGSTDGSTAMLDELARRDARLRLVRQENQGLSRALIRGCAEAQGEFIARHDADDVSLPGRLQHQVAFLQAHPEVTLLSCWVRPVGPEGEPLGEICPAGSPEEATARLRSPDPALVQGPAGHGSVMFRKADYLRAGGYRAQFYFAQDLDLWMRLTDFGLLAFLPEYLYEFRFDDDCISARYRAQQGQLANLVVQMIAVRQRGGDESPWLRHAEQIRPQAKAPSSPQRKAAGNYWIGRMLQKQRDPRALRYLQRALQHNPYLVRAWLALALGKIGIL